MNQTSSDEDNLGIVGWDVVVSNQSAAGGAGILDLLVLDTQGEAEAFFGKVMIVTFVMDLKMERLKVL